jgi:DNA-binding NtrC family response regulator
MDILRRTPVDVVILDIRLPDGNGLDALPRIRESEHSPEVIILSGSSDPDGAELAIRSGAWSYITKPPTLNKIQLPVQRAVEYHEKKKSQKPPVLLRRESIVGESRAMQQCLELVAQAAATEANALISGETGAGKEVFARAIHDNSNRAERPFVVVDCAALPENLVESMLFGHERGAFTGADRTATGLVRQAHGGTLFLDEVGELPLTIQKAFLRVLQTRRFRPVGGAKEVESDFRLVTATNRNLEEMVHRWTFRQDLLFRLRTIAIDLPPLRDRPSDIKPLTYHFIDHLCQKKSLPRKGFSNEFLEALHGHHWPGNVRELIHALEHALAAATDDPLLQPRHLPVDIRARLARNLLEDQDSLGEQDDHPAEPRDVPLASDEPPPGTEPKPAHPPDDGRCSHSLPENGPLPPLKEHRAQVLAQIERDYLERLMAQTGWDIPAACETAGLSRQRLYALLKEHGLRRDG